MLTYLQTVDIEMAGSTVGVQSLELCPIAPPGVLAMKKSDGSEIYWFPDYTKKWASDGTVYTWRKKPTIADAVSSRPVGNYFQFINDGSVFLKTSESAYYWSKPVSDIVEEGVEIKIHICPELNREYFKKGEKCPCRECLNCSRYVYNDYFCSERCERLVREQFTPQGVGPARSEK